MDAYVINLDSSSNKWDALQDRAKDIKSLNLIRFPAIQYSPGFVGCYLSHLALVRFAKDNNLPFILVLEDDATFEKDFDLRFNEALQWLQSNPWDLFHGGYLYVQPLEKINKQLIRIKGCSTTHFIMYNASVYDVFLKSEVVQAVDRWTYLTPLNKIAIYPMLSKQLAGYSDIELEDVDRTPQFDASESLMRRFSEA